MIDLALRDDNGLLVRSRGEQVHRPPVRLLRAAYALAVHRDRDRLAVDARGGYLPCQPGAYRRVQLVRIDGLDRPAQRGLVRGDAAAGDRVAADVQAGQRLLGQFPRVLADRDEAARARKRRSGRDRSHRGQTVADPTPMPRVRQPLQHCEQAIRSVQLHHV